MATLERALVSAVESTLCSAAGEGARARGVSDDDGGAIDGSNSGTGVGGNAAPKAQAFAERRAAVGADAAARAASAGDLSAAPSQSQEEQHREQQQQQQQGHQQRQQQQQPGDEHRQQQHEQGAREALQARLAGSLDTLYEAHATNVDVRRGLLRAAIALLHHHGDELTSGWAPLLALLARVPRPGADARSVQLGFSGVQLMVEVRLRAWGWGSEKRGKGGGWGTAGKKRQS
eukprot:12387-Chlamydomonas_euryale.AAC.1